MDTENKLQQTAAATTAVVCIILYNSRRSLQTGNVCMCNNIMIHLYFVHTLLLL